MLHESERESTLAALIRFFILARSFEFLVLPVAKCARA